jgi:hypothetical protein
MRLIAYALSAACGCAPAGYGYYHSYQTQPAAYVAPAYTSCEDTCGTVSTYGGDTALPVGYSYGYQPYYSPYYVGSPYMSYGYPSPHRRVRVGLQIEARNHHKIPITTIAQVSKKTKVAAVPLPKPRPKRVASHFSFPPGMVANVSDE